MLSAYLRDMLLAWVVRDGAYGSLHTKDPNDVGSSEVAGRGYMRLKFAFEVTAGRARNTAEDVYVNLPKGMYTHFGLWDASISGNFYWGGPLRDVEGEVGITVKDGERIVIEAGLIEVSMSGGTP